MEPCTVPGTSTLIIIDYGWNSISSFLVMLLFDEQVWFYSVNPIVMTHLMTFFVMTWTYNGSINISVGDDGCENSIFDTVSLNLQNGWLQDFMINSPMVAVQGSPTFMDLSGTTSSLVSCFVREKIFFCCNRSQTFVRCENMKILLSAVLASSSFNHHSLSSYKELKPGTYKLVATRDIPATFSFTWHIYIILAIVFSWTWWSFLCNNTHIENTF